MHYLYSKLFFVHEKCWPLTLCALYSLGLPHIDFRSITVPGTSSSTSQHGAIRPQQQASQPQQPLQRAAQPSTPMAFRGSSPQGLDDPALLQQMLLSNPHELSLLKERNPPLAEALLSGDLGKQKREPLILHATIVFIMSYLNVNQIWIGHVRVTVHFSTERFTKVLLEQQQDRAKREQERIRLLTADPFDLDAQAKIEEEIRYGNTN